MELSHPPSNLIEIGFCYYKALRNSGEERMDKHILSMCSLNKKGNIKTIWFGYKFVDGPEMGLRLKDVSEQDADMIAEKFMLFAQDIDKILTGVKE